MYILYICINVYLVYLYECISCIYKYMYIESIYKYMYMKAYVYRKYIFNKIDFDTLLSERINSYMQCHDYFID